AQTKDPRNNQSSINSPAKDDITRPLVLEERHSLSIAETKKRRASVYSSELLFIPKELARSELQQRTRTQNKNTITYENHRRMLKFPVRSGRARYVAKQMKKGQSLSKPKSEEKLDPSEMETFNCGHIKQDKFVEEPQLQDHSQIMPELDTESSVKKHLHDNEDISMFLFDLVKNEVGDNSLEETNRKIIQSQRQSVIRTSNTKLKNYPYLRWHNPEFVDSKMGFIEQWNLKSNSENQYNFSETTGGYNSESSNEFCNLEVKEENVQYLQDNEQEKLAQKDPIQPLQPHEPETPGYQNVSPQYEIAHQIHQTQLGAKVPATTYRTPGIAGQSTQLSLHQPTMHHIIQPITYNEEACQSTSCNNNAVEQINQNLRQHQYAETPYHHHHQWDAKGVENFADQSYHIQNLQMQQQYLSQHQYHHITQPSNHQQHEVIPHQHHLQELKVMHQRLKYRENEQLRHIGKSLKKLLEERVATERQHAEEKRLFHLKMEKSKKHEEKLKADKEQVQRQLRSDIRVLELRLAAQQRQQDGQSLAWTWQQQQHLHLQHQQLKVQQQSQQQNFEHHPHSQKVEAPQRQHPYRSQSAEEQFKPNQNVYQHPFIYPPLTHQEPFAYEQRLQAYSDEMPPVPAESHSTTATHYLQTNYILPQPLSYCQSSS
ncbi:hypothetical protein KR009_000397, partial [Drosophila setifemur]